MIWFLVFWLTDNFTLGLLPTTSLRLATQVGTCTLPTPTAIADHFKYSQFANLPNTPWVLSSEERRWQTLCDKRHVPLTLKCNDSTATRMSPKKWICVLSIFIAIILSYFVKCMLTLQNLNSKVQRAKKNTVVACLRSPWNTKLGISRRTPRAKR